MRATAGDKLRVLDDGKIVVLSFSDRKLYEIPPGALVQVENTALIPVRGMYKTISPSQEMPKEHNNIFTAWTPRKQSCIRIISPIDTAVPTLTPRLDWELNCASVDNKVTLRIHSGDSAIYELQTGETSLKVPKGILKGSNTYRWTVDAGKDGIVGATFSTLSTSESKYAIERRNEYGRNADDLPTRIAYILYLESKDLTEMARDEILKLKADFPDNPHIKVLAQEEPSFGTDEEPATAEAATLADEPAPAQQADIPETESSDATATDDSASQVPQPDVSDTDASTSDAPAEPGEAPAP